MKDITVLEGDCFERLKELEDNSVDSVCTDPPYGLSFMGKHWDHGVPSQEVWEEVLRVLKPGGHLLSFGGTRTYHRMACAIEDAGFEIRDQIQWIYGSGFPKSHNISKAIDKAAGAERKVIGRRKAGIASKNTTFGDDNWKGIGQEWNETAPATPEAQQWDGWGTALKPANEPIVLARKPLSEKTIAKNVLEHGTGGINIDECRVASPDAERKASTDYSDATGFHGGPGTWLKSGHTPPEGRWPANVIHDGSDEVMGEFAKAGESKSGVAVNRNRGAVRDSTIVWTNGHCGHDQGYGDFGTPARFFQQCKESDLEWLDLNLNLSTVNTAGKSLSLQNEHVASALEAVVNEALPEGLLSGINYQEPTTVVTPNELRRIGESVITMIPSIVIKCSLASEPIKLTDKQSGVKFVAQRMPTDTMMITLSHWRSDGSADPVTFSITETNSEAGEADSASRFKYCAKASKKERGEGNGHPTVKPLALMGYLVRLITPPGGTVLDPFAGSGTTLIAARDEGFKAIGIEKEEEYVGIIKNRLDLINDK